jgi:hypothetical protein
MAGPGYSLDTSSRVTTGPEDFGSTSSGGGTVVFGTSNPGVTAAVSNLTANPWMLAVAGAVVLGVAYLYLRSRRK